MFVQLQSHPAIATSLEHEINSFFDGWLHKENEPRPALNVAETSKETIIVAELPGLKKEDVSITMHDGLLTISGERKSPEAAKESTLLRNEIAYGPFTRTLKVGHPVNLDAINAELQNGVLRIVLPKAEEARPREIAVK